MSRTLEPGISLLTAAEIRVVVVPIGPMPRDTFESYLEALNVHRHVPLNATASFHQCGPKSPFPHLPYKTGAMHFRFMQAEDARRRSRVCDLHVQRNVVAVLGLLHCPLVEDLAAANSEFGRTVRQWPEAQVSRCVAFEPSPSHLAAPTAKLQDLMILPAGHLDAHLEVYMHEFAAAVLAAIEEHLLNANVSSIKLNTYVDSGDFLGSLVQIEEGLRKLNINEEEIKEKKRWGRLQKSKGDWSLLVGSPKDAFEHYKSAMELSRAAGDAIWFGAATEGLAHARVLEALLSARLAAGSSSHGRPGSTGSNSSSPAISPTKAAAAAISGAEAAHGTAAILPAETDKPFDATPADASSKSSTAADPAAQASAALVAAQAGVHSETAQQSPFAASDAGPEAPAVTHSANSASDSSGTSATASNRAASLPAMQPPVSPTAAAATAAAAAQLARRRSVGRAGGAAVAPVTYSLSGQAFCVMLASAGLEDEVRELLAEAKTWYKRKGGALPLQIEQSVKLCRFLACTAAGTAASAAGSSGSSAAVAATPEVEGLKTQLKAEVDAAVALILESLPALSLMEDRAIALAEAAQLLGLSGCGRKRLLLLWAALDLLRTGGTGPAAIAAGGGVSSSAVLELGPAPGAAVDVWSLLKMALAAMEPPDQPGQQDPDDVAKVHWSLKRFISWQQQHLQAGAATTPHTSQQQQSNTGSGSGSGASHQHPQPPWQQQQFQQLLGPQLQLLTPAQAAALEGPCLLQQTTAKPRQPGSPSKLSTTSSSAAGTQTVLERQQQVQLGLGVPIGVLAGLLNPGNQHQWMPGGGCLWDSLQVALLDVLVNAARAANAPVDAWEGAAALLREYYPLLPQSLQSSLMDSLAASGAAMGTRLRARPGPGPGPQAQFKRVVPGPACLQPQHLSAALTAEAAPGSSGGSTLRRGEGSTASGPFIYDPYSARRKGKSAAAAAQAALPEWVCGEEGRVEVVLVNPCATPLKLEGLQLQLQPQALPPAAPAAGTSSTSTSSGSGLVVQQRSVSVMLAAGSKPLRVMLGYTPNRSGYMAITGVQALSKGVSWYQPFVQLQSGASASGGGAAAAAAAAASVVVAAAAGRDGSKPQGCFTVLVQPQLPLIKASLQGPEVQLTLPSEEDLSSLSAASSSNSSSSSGPAPPGSGGSSWSSAAVYSSAAASSSSGVGVPGAALEKKAASVVVFEGQVLTWTLTLTNVSSQPITGCKVTVVNAKGVAPKAPSQQASVAGQQQQPPTLAPPSLTGAYLEVQGQGLAAGLPLNPGASMSLPVTVLVGKPPGSVYDASPVQVCITYHGTALSASSSEGCEGKLLGRSLTMSIKLAIQPTIQVKAMCFLQQGLPLRNGARDHLVLTKPQRLLLHSLRESRDLAAAGAAGAAAGVGGGHVLSAAAGAGGVLRKGPSHHVRNNSEGSVPVAGLSVGPVMPLPDSPKASTSTAAGGTLAAAGLLPPAALSSIPSSASLAGDGSGAAATGPSELATSPVKHSGAAGARVPASTAAAAAAAGGSLALSSQPVLELLVRNASERYFRTWLGFPPSCLSAEQALSAVAVLEPGDTVKLAAVVPTGGSAAAAAPVVADELKQPPRLAAAELLVERLVVCWEMITGAAAAWVLPHGSVPLEPLDVAANLTPVAWAALCPSPLHLRLSAPPAALAQVSQAPSLMVDLSTIVSSSGSSSTAAPRGGLMKGAAGSTGGAAGSGSQALSSSSGGGLPGLLLPGVTGPTWGLHMKVGQYLVFDLEVSCAAAAAAAPTPAASTSSQGTLELQVTLFVLDALSSSGANSSSTQQPGTPTAGTGSGPTAVDKAGSYAAALLSGQTPGPKGFAAALGGSATPKAGDALRSNSTAMAGAAGSVAGLEGLIDPGVLLTGCYNKLQVSVAPGSQHTCRMHALLVQPGLYVLGVADVQQLQQQASSGAPADAAAPAKLKAAEAAAAADSSLAGRVYYNQDRLYVLVTR